jgi:type II secretory ATPase GspE/PulE/Tfp pilus assembly ATPase PilB-like protein/ActR/RegA family two-component response regulator
VANQSHWITRVARGASLPGAGDVDVPARTPIAEAWSQVMAACGVDEDDLAAAIAAWFKLGVADLATADPAAAGFVPGPVARRYGVFPLMDEDHRLSVATADPCDVQAEQQIGFASGRTPVLLIAPPSRIAEYIEATYSPDRAVTTLIRRMDPAHQVRDPRVKVLDEEPAPLPAETLAEEADAGPVVKLTNMILEDAVVKAASDIHLQPLPTGGVIRLRIDGVLRSGITVPLPVLGRVISRIKIMSRLDISDRMRPQDGRARIRIGGHQYDLRVSTVPVRGGEKAVIRILDPAGSGALDESGLPAREVQRLRRVLRNRDGILVVTGPTGSGKTTTMYAALREIATEHVNIMTVEDPVEYELPGLTQIQVDTKQGITFQSALKAILRQDPDVIFVGEIRDQATAETAAQASLTGHLVLATVHANDAVGSVRRFLDLGLEAGTIAETLRGALAQRLLRTLCTDCAQPLEADLLPEEAELAQRYSVQPTMRPVGCEACGHSGYRGRRPVVEMILPTPELLRLVASEASHMDLIAQAREDGMRSMLEGALDLVAEGLTTLSEVERVIGEDTATAGAPQEPRLRAGDGAGGGSAGTGETPAMAVETPNATEPERLAVVDISAATREGERTVLVVEDDADVRLLVRTLLEGRGWTVREVVNGGDALVQVGRIRDLSLVILDLGLPDIEGISVLKAMRRNPDVAHIPVIVLTGRTDRSTERQVLLEGADDYIPKPVDPPILLMRAQAVLRRTVRA